MKRNLTEMDRLEAYLKENHIVYERIDHEDMMEKERKLVVESGIHIEPMERHQIIAFDKDGRRTWDVICHRGSYGAERGLLEGMGDIFNEDVEGNLTAAEIIQRIEIQTGRR